MEQTNKLWESDLKLYGNNNFIAHSFCYLASFFKRRAFPCNHRATFTAKHKVLQIVLTSLYKICRLKKRIQQMKNRKFLPRSVDALSSVFPPKFFFWTRATDFADKEWLLSSKQFLGEISVIASRN